MLGELSALATAVMWTISSIVFAEATKRVGSFYVNVTRLVVASLVLGSALIVFQLPLPSGAVPVFYLALSGFVGLVFGDVFLFKSYEYNSPRISSLVMSIAPALAALLGMLFLDEFLTFWGLIGMVVTLAGVGMVVLERNTGRNDSAAISMKGVFYAFLGAIGQAGGLVLAKQGFMHEEVNSITATFIRIATAAIIILPLSVITGRFNKPIVLFRSKKGALGYTLAGTIAGPVLGVTLSIISIMHAEVAVAATLMAVVPVLMLPTVYFLYKEELSWRAIVGACVAVGGVALLFLR